MTKRKAKAVKAWGVYTERGRFRCIAKSYRDAMWHRGFASDVVAPVTITLAKPKKRKAPVP
jgi:hypothetical protein